LDAKTGRQGPKAVNSRILERKQNVCRAARSLLPGHGRPVVRERLARARRRAVMTRFIRAALIMTLGLGLNVLCGDAWADGGPRRSQRGASSPESVEDIWNTP
jgi:hypothetical protein